MNIYRNMAPAEGDDPPKSESAAVRRCLTCQKDFDSKHKFNRICRRCKFDFDRKNIQAGGGDDDYYGESITPPSQWSIIY